MENESILWINCSEKCPESNKINEINNPYYFIELFNGDKMIAMFINHEWYSSYVCKINVPVKRWIKSDNTNITKLYDKIILIINQIFNINSIQLSIDTNLIKDLKFTQLDYILLGIALEDEFDISIQDENLERFITIQDIIKYLNLYI